MSASSQCVRACVLVVSDHGAWLVESELAHFRNNYGTLPTKKRKAFLYPGITSVRLVCLCKAWLCKNAIIKIQVFFK